MLEVVSLLFDEPNLRAVVFFGHGSGQEVDNCDQDEDKEVFVRILWACGVLKA